MLGRVAREAVREHPGTFARSVLGDFWKELWKPLFAGRVAPTSADPGAAPAGPGATVVVDGRGAPGADRGRADPLRVPERADVDARHEHP